jgi:hypothetical protein
MGEAAAAAAATTTTKMSVARNEEMKDDMVSFCWDAENNGPALDLVSSHKHILTSNVQCTFWSWLGPL